MSKYGNKKCVVDVIEFDSIREGTRYKELTLMQRAGVIHDLNLQVPFKLIPNIKTRNGHVVRGTKYVADFTYRDGFDRMIVEDAKGVRTDVYKLKKKMMLWIYGIEIQEV